MKNNLLIALAACTILWSCNSSTTNPTDPDACTCAKEELKGEAKNAETVTRCGQLRSADLEFEKKFQECYIASKSGLNEGQVKLSAPDSSNTINLPNPDNGTYTIASASKANWMAKKVTGQHNGVVSVKSGFVTVENGKLVAAEVNMDMSTITVLDLTGEEKGKLEGHLKSDDFFGADKFKDAKFVMTQATQKGNVQYEVKGTLTIKGKAMPQVAMITLVPSAGGKMTVSGGMAIDRTTFDIKYGSGKFFKDLGDKMIDDMFNVVFDLKATKS
jgi:polyisoprenoid-binding protein YceI